MKSIINFFKNSNHYLHTILLAILSLITMSLGAFEFGSTGIWTNVWQTIKFGLMTGLIIEVYQIIVSKSVDLKNSVGDLFADLIGLIVGTGLYDLLSIWSPITAIILLITSVISVLCATIFFRQHKYILGGIFLICLLVGFSLFIYA